MKSKVPQPHNAAEFSINNNKNNNNDNNNDDNNNHNDNDNNNKFEKLHTSLIGI